MPAFNSPSHSIWVQDGKLQSLGLHGRRVAGEIFNLRYMGEGSSQNSLVLQKNHRSLSTKNVNCAIESR